MTAEIDRLGADDRALLRHAAVLGVTFPLSVLADMLGRTDQRSDEIVWQRLADFVPEEEPGTFRFRHALLRDAAYEGLPYRRRRELHAAAGDAIARTSDPGFADRAATLVVAFLPRPSLRGRVALRAHRGGSRSKQVRAGGGRGALPPRAGRGSNVAGIPAREIADVHEARGDLLDRFGAYGEAADSYRAARRLVGGDPLAESKLYLKEAWISRARRALPAGAPMGHPGAPGARRRRGQGSGAGNERASPPGTRRSARVRAATGR